MIRYGGVLILSCGAYYLFKMVKRNPVAPFINLESKNPELRLLNSRLLRAGLQTLLYNHWKLI
jgi:hypothetical protein